MQKIAAISTDFQVIQKVIVDTLNLTGYVVESASVRVEPAGDIVIVNFLFAVRREG